MSWFTFDLTCHTLLDQLNQLIGNAKENKDSDWRYIYVKYAWIDVHNIASYQIIYWLHAIILYRNQSGRLIWNSILKQQFKSRCLEDWVIGATWTTYSKSLLLLNALISFSKFDHIVCKLYFYHQLDFASQLFIII